MNTCEFICSDDAKDSSVLLEPIAGESTLATNAYKLICPLCHNGSTALN